MPAGAVQVLRTIPSRVAHLLVKVISVKGLVLALATWLVYEGKLDSMTWTLAAGAVVGARAWEKQKAGRGADGPGA